MQNTLIGVFSNAFKEYSDHVALRFRNKSSEFEEMNYTQLDEITDALAVGLLSLGIKKQDHIGLIADVSHTWTITDIAIQKVGAVDVPRGTDSNGDELAYIISHSGSNIVAVANAKEIDKIAPALKKKNFSVKKYIIMDSDIPSKHASVSVSWDDLISEGRKKLSKENSAEAKKLKEIASSIEKDDLATIIYTSGTTGEPKGVMTTQYNLAFQLNVMPKLLKTTPDDRGLTLLPPWHIFGRIAEYLFLATGVSITYTDIKNIGDDMKTIKPTLVPAVPRIWEGIYNKVVTNVRKGGKEPIFNFFKKFALKFEKNLRILQNREIHYKKKNFIVSLVRRLISLIALILLLLPKKLGDILVFKKVLAATGGKLRASISGGGALPGYIDEFFAAIGITIVEGYGMTETSPIISARLIDRIVPGTVGPPLEQTECKLIDLEGNDVTSILGAKGTLHVKGPQVMKGYYKNPDKTNEVLTSDGWMNTGDLVRINTNGELSVVGRSKDTIVLVGGENVEPTPIEEKIKESDYVDHIMAVGQDAQKIGALIVPNEEEIKKYAKSKGISTTDLKSLVENDEIVKLFKGEIKRLVSAEAGFKSFERIGPFRLLTKPFEQGDELNNTLKVKRHVVTDKYSDLISEMYK